MRKMRYDKSFVAPTVVLLFCIVLLVIIIIQYITRPPYGDTSTTQINLESSTIFSKDELLEVTNLVKEDFQEYRDCKLEKLWYNEEQCTEIAQSQLQFSPKYSSLTLNDIVVILGQFSSGSDGYSDNCYFLPSDTYQCRWILTRTPSGSWKIDGRLVY